MEESVFTRFISLSEELRAITAEHIEAVKARHQVLSERYLHTS
jgi:hypothetical protein